MLRTDQTLLEQMRITDFEIDHRKKLFSITDADVQALKRIKPAIEHEVDTLVAEFYATQTSVPEIALLIGDFDTLSRLRNAQRRYVLDLFSGFYDIEYVNNRLRIGLVHKRIGVEPKLYVSAVYTLRTLLLNTVAKIIPDQEEHAAVVIAIEKLFMFDVTLVFETYIRSLLTEIEVSKEKSEQYAHALEAKVKERTQQLEEMSRTDPLTGLLNVRYLAETLTQVLRSSERRSEPVTVAYFDINKFKIINDTQGHQRGDEILRIVANGIKTVSRAEDHCFRYGGDEFCIVMANCTEAQAADIYGPRLSNEIHKVESDLTMSVGYAQTGPKNYLPQEELIRLADERMYAAKIASKLKDQASSTVQS